MEQSEIPGLLIASPPRRSERSRSGDLLLVLFTLPGDLVAATTRQELQQHLVSAYFRTRGTVTSALRAAIGELNNSLLRRNLRTREGTMQSLLTVAVLRRDMLTLAHVGMTQSYLLRPGEAQRLNEFREQRGGAGRQPHILPAFQPGAASGRVTCSCWPPTHPQPGMQPRWRRLPGCQSTRRAPGCWHCPAAMWKLRWRCSSPAQGRSTRSSRMRPRAHRRPRPTASAAAGESGRPPLPQRPNRKWNRRLRLLKRKNLRPRRPKLNPKILKLNPQKPGTNRQRPQSSPASPSRRGMEGIYLSGLPGEAAQEPLQEPPARPTPQRPLRRFKQPAEERPERSERNERKPIRLPNFNLRKRLAPIWRSSRRTGRRIDQGSKTIAGRILPGQQQLSPALMLFMAVAVPIVVVAIAATIYLYAPNGRSEQQMAYLDQAVQYAAQAQQDDNEVLKRNSWGQVLYWLEEADRFGKTDELASLRKQARTALDAMDGISRMDLQPVIRGGFDASLHFTHMAASPTDVYLLDSGQGSIFHMNLTGSGYQFDTRFECGPGLISQMQMGEEPVNQVQVGALLDLVLLPPGNAFGANVMGIDAGGNLIYCKPGGLPKAAALPLPDTGWGTITNVTVDQGLLYILDKQNNRIWVYVGTDYNFENDPRLYFDNEVPELTNVVSIAVNGEDMFLLHDDGEMTNCTFRQFAGDQTRCADGVAYGDLRPGRNPNDLITFSEAKFVSMQVTRAPDSSLYMLDANSSSVYHFSLRLNLQNQYRSDMDASGSLPGSPPTAFAVTSARVILVAFDSQVYYGSMP